MSGRDKTPTTLAKQAQAASGMTLKCQEYRDRYNHKGTVLSNIDLLLEVLKDPEIIVHTELGFWTKIMGLKDTPSSYNQYKIRYREGKDLNPKMEELIERLGDLMAHTINLATDLFFEKVIETFTKNVGNYKLSLDRVIDQLANGDFDRMALNRFKRKGIKAIGEIVEATNKTKQSEIIQLRVENARLSRVIQGISNEDVASNDYEDIQIQSS